MVESFGIVSLSPTRLGEVLPLLRRDFLRDLVGESGITLISSLD